MTQLLKSPSDVSNFFDLLERGIGHRGSSFTDFDRLCWTHNARGGPSRFLVRELKAEGEKEMSDGQRWALESLARVPNFTVWGGRHLGGNHILFVDFGSGLRATITGEEWKQRVEAWWDRR